MPKENCPVCGEPLFVGYRPWHIQCKSCRYEGSTLETQINLDAVHQLIDETARETGLKRLRIDNFKFILSLIEKITPNRGSLLDVGCAHGWFLETVRSEFDAVGLEPDKNIYEYSARRGLPVRMGYFPEALGDGEKFDIIVFNDVIEHIKQIRDAISSCHDRLRENGVLVLNLPSSNGVLYLFSKLMCRLGCGGFFDRMWQKGLPSPHLHYLNLSNVAALLKEGGFEVTHKRGLPAVRLAGLYMRLSYTGNLGRVAHMCMYLCMALALPLIKLLPCDIMLVIATRKDKVTGK
jgi:2-polyprenyl-3-methyl-5-hydroxy-6-metoxy-1,4-benzoquinol methylase